MLYGFVPQTYCGTRVGQRCSERTGVPDIRGDGDPMDICILSENTMAHANFFLRARPIGGLRMIDGDELELVATDEVEIKARRTLHNRLMRGVPTRLLPPKKAARYLQLESKIRAVLAYDIAATIPLVR